MLNGIMFTIAQYMQICAFIVKYAVNNWCRLLQLKHDST